jgi:hypothetical protein
MNILYRLAKLLKLILAAFIFIPVTLGSIGLNYSFLLIGVFYCIRRKKVRTSPSPVISITLYYYIFLYFCGLLVSALVSIPTGNISFDALSTLPAFGIFLAPYFLLFTPLTQKDAFFFLDAALLFSIIYSIATIIAYFLILQNSSAPLDLELIKNSIGSQRSGFIIVSSFWYLILGTDYKSTLVLNKELKTILAIIIAAGCLLTFSRSTLISLLGGFLAYIVISISLPRKLSIRSMTKLFPLIIAILLIFILLCGAFHNVFDFYMQRFELLGSSSPNTSSDMGSVGTRLYISDLALSLNPYLTFFGNNFRGISTLLPSIGSAHNQYLDVYFRVGFLGLIAYISQLCAIFIAFAKKNKNLLPGYISVLIYGFMHETFREPQGSALFALLLVIAFTRFEILSTSTSTCCHE